MEMASLILSLAFSAISLHSNEKWIPLVSPNKPHNKKRSVPLDVNVSQARPMNNLIKNATLIKELFEKKRKEVSPQNDKNWFVINNGSEK